MVIVLFRYLEPLLYEGCVDLTARTVNTVADAPRYKSIIRQLDSTRGSRGIHSTCTYGLQVSKDDQQVFCLAGPKSKTRCQKELDQGYFSEEGANVADLLSAVSPPQTRTGSWKASDRQISQPSQIHLITLFIWLQFLLRRMSPQTPGNTHYKFDIRFVAFLLSCKYGLIWFLSISLSCGVHHKYQNPP